MIPTHDNCFFAFFPCTVHTIRSMGQYESHLPNIWRINTWSKSIVKSDGNHHVCRFLLVLFVCQIVNITLWNPKTCGSSSTRYSKKTCGSRRKQKKKKKISYRIIQGRNLKGHSENDILTGSKRSRLQRPRSTSHPAFSLMAIWTSAADVVWRPRNSLEVY